VQVRAGDPAGCSDFADDVAGLQVLAELHADLRQVAIHRRQSLAVVDDHVVAVEVVLAHVDDLARDRRLDRRARGRRDVHATVRPARFAVENPSQAEGTRLPARHRRGQPQRRRRVGRECGERRRHLLALPGDARRVLGRRIHHGRRDLELLRPVPLRQHLERDAARIRARLLHFDGLLAGLDVQRDADHRQPPRSLPHHHDRPSVVRDHRFRVRRAGKLERGDATRHHGRPRRRELRGLRADRRQQQEGEGGELIHR
jgi:hypothetical protein